MSEHCMPILIINMGGEMLYILEQRLQAQNIVQEKSLRVLQDVIATMFSDKFIRELFKPQRLYSSASTRQIFDRLAHSSIMRLNTSSMDKLYDLMTMGCKYQILAAHQPQELLSISLNHIDALRKIVANNASVAKLVELAYNNLIELFHSLKLPQYYCLRNTLCRFFQDRRVKVSLFLQDQIQFTDGSIVIHGKGRLPNSTLPPGSITYYDGNSSNGAVVVKQEVIPVKQAQETTPPIIETDVTKSRVCELGTNLYAKDRRKMKSSSSSAAAGASSASSSVPSSGLSSISPAAKKSVDVEVNEESKAAAKAELNRLASMIGHSSAASSSGEKNTFTISNLFPDTAASVSGEDQTGADFLTFEDAEDRKAFFNKFDDLDLKDEQSASGAGAGAGSGDDLLDLMDNAGQ